ncbi:MAG: hypothetical protein ACYDHO_05610 [Gaiellaceae bacterium]
MIRRYGYDVVTLRDEGFCSAKDMIAVFDNTEQRDWDTVLKIEGHINCGIRRKPIYQDHAKVVSEENGNWYDIRYENLECGLELTGAGTSIERRTKFREIFEQLKRG